MNAGMYHPDRAPVGSMSRMASRADAPCHLDGPGNFGLLPNGVFCIADTVFRRGIARPSRKHRPACRFATQSGPDAGDRRCAAPALSPELDLALHPQRRRRQRRTGGPHGLAISRERVNFARIRPRSSATGWARPMRSTSTATSRASTRPRSGATTSGFSHGADRGRGRSGGLNGKGAGPKPPPRRPAALETDASRREGTTPWHAHARAGLFPAGSSSTSRRASPRPPWSTRCAGRFRRRRPAMPARSTRRRPAFWPWPSARRQRPSPTSPMR